jgi:protein gp37
MSDLFHPDVPINYVAEVWAAMLATPRHTYQVLTKRPQILAHRLGVWLDVDAQPGIWLGTSIELDEYAFRADRLRDAPAALRFLSLEPLLGPLPSLSLTDIDWVIVGAESGPAARPMQLEWVRDIRDRCQAAGVPLFVKQLTNPKGRVYKDISEFPPDLRIREMPDA